MQEANVSIHGCTEYEVLSLDAGLRMDNLLAFDLWDVVVEVSRSSKITESSTHGAAGNCSRTHKSKPKQKGNRDVDQLSHVDHVTTNAHSSQGESQLVQFEDNEAVIKMINQGQKSNNETRFKNSQSCVRLIGCLTESIWAPRSKPNMLTPKTNSLTY